jgi:toxin ParE1/3/4
MAYRILFSPGARRQLEAIDDYIAEASTADTARRFTDAILDYIATLSDFPHRGAPRDDLASGLRTLSFRKRVTIAFAVEPEAVLIIGIFYGGQDFETLLHDA